MRTVTFIDTTMRDGAQAPDIFFTQTERTRIAGKLIETGITEIEAGIPVMGEDECKAIRAIVEEFPSCRISSWCRADVADIHAAEGTGCDTVHISFPVSDIHLGAIHKDETWLFDTVNSIISKAKNSFDRVTVGIQDASRATIPRIFSFIQACLSFGVWRFRIADTVGILTPIATSELVNNIIDRFPAINLDFHAHNDLGMASANAITALMSGASAVSVTVNGIGERAGNAAFEEVVTALTVSVPELSHSINTNGISGLCRMVEDMTGRLISPCKPITGTFAFTHESGIHCDALIKDPNTYEPFDPSLVGRPPSSFVAGSHSGSSGIRAMLGESGKNIAREKIKKLLPLIRNAVLLKKRSLLPSEVKEILNNGERT